MAAADSTTHYVQYYTSGKIRVESDLRDGLLNGLYVWNYPSGTPFVRCYYERGILHGFHETYTTTGAPYSTRVYRYGELTKISGFKDSLMTELYIPKDILKLM